MRRPLLLLLLIVGVALLGGCSEEPPLVPQPVGLTAVKEANLPSAQLLIPVPTANPAFMSPGCEVVWVAERAKLVRFVLIDLRDFGNDIEAALTYLRMNPDAPEWTEWQRYDAPDGSGRFWTPPPLDFGEYVFAVQARRGSHLTDPVLGASAARVRVALRSTGPILSVFNRYIGTMRTAVTNTPPTIIDIPSGVPMSFTLSASAEAYGGVVAGYRYDWDLLDPDDDEEWGMDFTPFVGETAHVPVRRFFFGTHTLFIETIDNCGFKSRIRVQLNFLQAPMERPLLLVDDFREPAFGWVFSRGATPNDDEHDAFWQNMVGDVAGFDPVADVIDISASSAPPSLQTMLTYKNMVWSAFENHLSVGPSVLNQLLRWIDPRATQGGGKVAANSIALYMAAGGHVMLCGGEVMTSVINRASFDHLAAFPIIFRYELGGDQDGDYEDSVVGVKGIGDESFAYGGCCLNVLDVAYTPAAARKSPEQACPVGAVRTQDRRTDGLRVCAPLDNTTGGGFPILALRPEAAGDPTKFFHESRSGLNSDVYNPTYFQYRTSCGEFTEYGRDCFEPIYAHEGVTHWSAISGAPVAFWTSVFADRVPPVPGGVAARSTVWGFSPVYFNPGQVKQAMDVVLFDEWQLPRR